MCLEYDNIIKAQHKECLLLQVFRNKVTTHIVPANEPLRKKMDESFKISKDTCRYQMCQIHSQRLIFFAH